MAYESLRQKTERVYRYFWALTIESMEDDESDHVRPAELGRSAAAASCAGVHENFAQAVSGALSAFLQTEIGVHLETIAFVSAADFHRTLQSPSGVISFQLGAAGRTGRFCRSIVLPRSVCWSCCWEAAWAPKPRVPAQARNLTEIEWALLEEVVRVLVASLGEAWKAFHAVEFKVLTLENDPELLPVPDPARPLVHLGFALVWANRRAAFQIAVPQTFLRSERPVRMKRCRARGAEQFAA